MIIDTLSPEQKGIILGAINYLRRNYIFFYDKSKTDILSFYIIPKYDVDMDEMEMLKSDFDSIGVPYSIKIIYDEEDQILNNTDSDLVLL